MFCRIYINGIKVRNQFLLFQLCDLLKEKPIDNSYIENDIFSISVTNNDEYHEGKAKEFPDGFIYFPLSIEIDFYMEDQIKASVIVNRILEFLWDNKYSAITSCKFEDLLLKKGGYNNKSVPWIGSVSD